MPESETRDLAESLWLTHDDKISADIQWFQGGYSDAEFLEFMKASRMRAFAEAEKYLRGDERRRVIA